ncbi:MAG TPA: SpoIID/LytB domain-containing protein [Candidatus Polarisedimenticolaceae bacterium]
MFSRLVVATVVAGAAVGGAAADAATDAIRALATAASPPGKLIRIGLEPARRVTIRSAKPYRIVDPSTGTAVGNAPQSGEVVVVADGGPEEDAGSIYRVQVAAFETREAAEAEATRLRDRFGVPAVVRFVPDRGSWRVRLGEGDDRASLAPVLEKLRDAGFQGIWIAEEPRREVSGVTLRLVDARWNDTPTARGRLAVVAEPGATIEVGGKGYRGVVELRVDPQGRIRPVNWLELETYLRGVVPSELGPEIWPQLEALKAQAVAARTYAVANLGQFEEGGYDLCATPRCQAYGGASAEHPLSDRAIAATAGEILAWDGKPIAALYTATCGGHTEDAKEIFPEQAAPYLKGVPCRAEADGLAQRKVSISGRPIDPLVDETGTDVTREVALLAAAGVLVGEIHPRAMRHEVGPAELRRWTRALAAVAGRPAPSGPERPTATLAQALAAAARDLGLDERARVLVGDGDAEALLRDASAAALAPEERRIAAYFAWIGLLRPLAGGGFGLAEPASRARIAWLLAGVGDIYEAFSLREATFSGPDGAALRFVQGRGDLSVAVGGSPFVFGTLGGRSVPAPSLQLWPGDRVRFRRGSDGRIDFLELRPPVKGASDDRSAAVYAWDLRRSREELEATIEKRIGVGDLQDLRVKRRGVSGRVVELEVVGSRGTTVVKGFDIRGLLDLRENLVVLEPQRDAQGRLDAVVFAGKGWGHGVGLCQVGAYGMAVRGADYRQILSHYYSGASLTEIP